MFFSCNYKPTLSYIVYTVVHVESVCVCTIWIFINVDLPFDKLDFWDMYSSTFQNVVHFILIVVMIYFIKVFFPLCPFPYRNYMALFNCQNLSDYYFFLFDHHNAIHEGRRHITCKSPVIYLYTKEEHA